MHHTDRNRITCSQRAAKARALRVAEVSHRASHRANHGVMARALGEGRTRELYGWPKIEHALRRHGHAEREGEEHPRAERTRSTHDLCRRRCTACIYLGQPAEHPDKKALRNPDWGIGPWQAGENEARMAAGRCSKLDSFKDILRPAQMAHQYVAAFQ